MNYSNTYYALTVPCYSRVGECQVDGEIEKAELNMPNN